jgi:hypothetical protein
VDLTHSYKRHLPKAVLDRYEFAEVRNAAAILKATNPAGFAELIDVLTNFKLLKADLLDAGGSESKLAARLNGAFRAQGWREARVDTYTRLSLVLKPYAPAGEKGETTAETETTNEGYLVDNFKDRMALDVEWNAKDGNLDRDIAAYRSLYDTSLIDGAVIVSRTQTDLRALGFKLGKQAGMSDERAKKILGTTTTTNREKLLPRMTRGDSGGCPLLAVFICAETM